LCSLKQTQPGPDDLTGRPVPTAVYLTRNELLEMITETDACVSGHGNLRRMYQILVHGLTRVKRHLRIPQADAALRCVRFQEPSPMRLFSMLFPISVLGGCATIPDCHSVRNALDWREIPQDAALMEIRGSAADRSLLDRRTSWGREYWFTNSKGIYLLCADECSNTNEALGIDIRHEIKCPH